MCFNTKIKVAGFGWPVTIFMSSLNQSLGCSWRVDLESFGKLWYRKPFSQELSRKLKLSEGSKKACQRNCRYYVVQKHGVKCYKEDICKSWLAQSGHLSAAMSSWLKKEQKRGINQTKGKSERIEACSCDGRFLLQVED